MSSLDEGYAKLPLSEYKELLKDVSVARTNLDDAEDFITKLLTIIQYVSSSKREYDTTTIFTDVKKVASALSLEIVTTEDNEEFKIRRKRI